MILMNYTKFQYKLFNFLFLSCFFSLSTLAQNTLTEYKKTYPDYNELIINNQQSYNISIENKKLKIIQDNHFESMILSENGIQNNKESFSYSNLVKLNNYDAYALFNDNGKEKKIKVSQSNEKPSKNGSVFFDDVMVRELTFNNLETGSKKVYNYQTEFIDPYLLHKFIFGDELPIQNSTLEITTEKDIEIGYKIFNDPNNSIVFSKSEKKGKWIYKWTLKDIKPLKYENNAPGYLYIVPHINFYIKNYVIDNQTNNVLGNIDNLYSYYKGFIKDLNKEEDTLLKNLTLEITQNKKTDEEKIKAIFYWVKENIKYIAFENGYEGFIPREASLVFQRKFGDCKDMGNMINCMAKYAEIKDVTIAWIGTRSLPYTYNDLPTPAVDNHMIAVFKKNDNYIFLDATDNETNYGIPTAFIQGKEALLYENEKYKIVKVPIVPAENNTISDDVSLSIKNNKLIGTGKLKLEGYNRSHTLMKIGDTYNKTRFESIKNLVLKGSNKFNLTEYNEENKNDKDKPYIINYNFDLDNYIIQLDSDLYINLFLDKFFDDLLIEKNRISDFDFEYLTQFSKNYNLEIPKKYNIKQIPKNFSINNDCIKADFIYELKDGNINLNITLIQKKLTLNKSDFELWNSSIKALKTNYNQVLILSKKI
ncbi:hypothetical protein GCM10008015_29130 [Flavobacterium palustre]|uniref:DUF3857 domain-containing protein n=1 Tax=Flavobacterium palustre TaxID=1476463 RepID=A0ABQ1HR51_9FLAO|nr:DUF3857 domain-containing protein [Flavobacterium palustre]GGA86631.1 hypothetical protein GCM10008015_29130 [Flavobacterium palustre]